MVVAIQYLTLAVVLHLSFEGGWAGGEAALWQLREAVLAEKQATQTATTKQATATQRASVPKPSAGTDAIYLGFGKE